MFRSRIPYWLGWGLACVFLGMTVLLLWRPPKDVATSRPINPEPDRFVKQIFSFDKLLQPNMGEERLIYEYRGGYIDCWMEVVTDGKKEVVGLISNQQLRKEGQKMPADSENNVHGQIFWDPASLGAKDLTFLVTATADYAQGLGTSIGLQRGMNHLVKEKYPELWNGKQLGTSWHGPETSTLVPGEEKLLYAFQLTGGEIRLLCKLVVGSK